MDSVIAILVKNLVDRIDEMEREIDFDCLLNLPEESLRDEARFLHRAIEKLKGKLLELQG